MKRTRRTKTRFAWRWLTAAGMAISLLAGILTTAGAKAEIVKERPASALAKYAIDLTAAAKQGRFNSIAEKTDGSLMADGSLIADRCRGDNTNCMLLE